MKHWLHRTLTFLIGTLGLPSHYEEEKLSSIVMKDPPAPRFKQEIIYSVHLEKQLSIDMKAWKCGEEKYFRLKLFVGSRLAAMLLSGKT